MPGGSHLKSPSQAEEAIWCVAASICSRVMGVRLPLVLDTHVRGAGRVGGKDLAAHRATQAAVYLAAVGGNLSGRALCRATGFAPPSIRYHLKAVEDERELRAQLDALMDELAERLAGMTGVVTRRAA